jgi:multidrug efflux pump subunit AcrA (membrane-fusion protein)
MKKWIWIVICVVVIGFVGYQWYNSKTSAKIVSAQVRTALVEKGKLEVKISGSGTVQAVTSVDIKSLITNDEIDEVLVSAGEVVKSGDELVTFTDDSDPITATTDGVITLVAVAADERVTNGQVVAHITNYTDLQTVVQVDELDIPKIKKDQTVSLSASAFPEQTYTGKVTGIAEEGTSTNGVSSFAVTIHIEKPDNLKVGMSTEASILTESKENILYVPVDGVYTTNDKKYVLVTATTVSTDTSTSTSSQKTVKTGIATEDYVELTDGVTEGETIELPALASGSTSSTTSGGMGGMSGMGALTGGGMPPNGGGQGAPSGRSGN